MPRNKYPEETIQKILDAALKLFLEKGYEQTTVLDIVDNMGGLTRGAFYHHFKSKEEVLDALGNKLFSESDMYEKLKQEKNLTGLERLKRIMLISTEDSQLRRLGVMSIQALKSPTFIMRVIESNRDMLAPLLQEFIEDGIEDGSIQSTNPKLLAELLTFLANFWTIPTIYPAGMEETIQKLFYIKEITDKLGAPIFDDELIEIIIKEASEEEK